MHTRIYVCTRLWVCVWCGPLGVYVCACVLSFTGCPPSSIVVMADFVTAELVWLCPRVARTLDTDSRPRSVESLEEGRTPEIERELALLRRLATYSNAKRVTACSFHFK